MSVQKHVSVLGIVALAVSPVFAVLGESESEAEGKASRWKQEYGAVAPIISTDASGTVIRECWSAPPRMWTEAEALGMAQRLLPQSARANAMKPVAGKSGTFRVEGGFTVYLHKFRDRVTDVEVAADSYKGPRC